MFEIIQTGIQNSMLLLKKTYLYIKKMKYQHLSLFFNNTISILNSLSVHTN